MIRRSFALLAAASLVSLTGVPAATAQESRPSSEFGDEYDRYSDQQLDNLVGAVALYPDALLAQVLVAATFPDQIEEAARFVRSNGTDDVDDQNWDVSVKAVAHYPSALNMLADKIDWTTALGRAYAVQSSDVMAAVQRMRGMADAQGNLRNTAQQTVVRDDGNYVIAPAQTRVIYVPVYDPYVVYTRPIFVTGLRSSFWSFGVGFPIGAWLTYDCNWPRRAVYYNGWDAQYYGYAGGWRYRSRPFITITNIYVNPRYRTVFYNRDVIRRRVIYQNVDRYPGVHRDTRFSRGPVIYRGSSRSDGYDRGYDRSYDRDGQRPYDRRSDTWNDRRDDRRWDNRSDSRRTDGSDRREDRGNSVFVPQGQGGSVGRPYGERTVLVPQGQGGSIGRPADSRGDNGTGWGGARGDGRSGGMRDVNPGGTWGRDNAGTAGGRDRAESSQGGWSRGSDGMRAGDRPSRDEFRGRDNAGNRWGGGNPSEMFRSPQRNDAPMINPRRAERMEAAPPGGGRGAGPGVGMPSGGRGARTARELP